MPFSNINHEFPATRFAPSLFTASPCWAVPGTPKTNGYCLRARAPHCWGLVIACASEGTCAFAHCSLWIKGELFWGQLAYIALSLNSAQLRFGGWADAGTERRKLESSEITLQKCMFLKPTQQCCRGLQSSFWKIKSGGKTMWTMQYKTG